MDPLKRVISRSPLGFLWRCLDRAGPHYLALILSGVLGYLWPTPSMQDSTNTPIAFYAWLGGLSLGGLLCAVGRWSDKPSLGVIGLSLILVDLMTYVVSLTSRWPDSAAGICFMVSIISLFGYRLCHKVKTRDARAAIRRGNPTRSDLATYAFDRLAGSRSNRGGCIDGSESGGAHPREEGEGYSPTRRPG